MALIALYGSNGSGMREGTDGRMLPSTFSPSLRSRYTVKNATLYLRDIAIYSVVRVGNYLDQKETMLCTNNYTLTQIDTLCLF